MNQAALAHLGERQTEVHFESRPTSDFWRYCVRSTEAAVSFAFLAAVRRISDAAAAARLRLFYSGALVCLRHEKGSF